MTTFEPGRIYSGVVSGERRLLTLSQKDVWYALTPEHPDGLYTLCLPVEGEGIPADIRGPLVVLDLDRFETEIVHDILVRSIRPSANKAADQIKEQTRPPLQVGWHEVKNLSTALYFDGREWRAGPRRAALSGDWTSKHYIGPASGDPND